MYGSIASAVERIMAGETTVVEVDRGYDRWTIRLDGPQIVAIQPGTERRKVVRRNPDMPGWWWEDDCRRESPDRRSACA